MHKTILILFLFTLSSISVGSSGLPKLQISELHSKSDLIILAQVIAVKQDSSNDKVEVYIIEFIKGNSVSKKISINLQVRGGLKEFDPELKANDIGVFYLKKTTEGYATSHGGSIALFIKKSFIRPMAENKI